MNTLDLSLVLNRQGFHLNVKQSIKFTGILGVFGASGSGKTTLLRTLAGLTTDAVGTITFNQQRFQHSNKKVCVQSDKRRISMVFQDARLFPHLTVEQNLRYARKRCKNATLTIEDIIELTGISQQLGCDVNHLSGGEQQRVALARALLAEPQLLLLDEPLSALDRTSKIALVALLKKIQSTLKLPMIYVSHSAEELQQLADHLLVIEQGTTQFFDNIHIGLHHLSHHELVRQQTSISGVINHINDKHGLIEIQCHGHALYLSPPTKHLPDNNEDFIGAAIRCYIFASDISISVEHPSTSSIVNLLPAKIVTIVTDGALVLVTLTSNEQVFLASISSYSLEKLCLSPEQNVYIQFKASAVRTLTNLSQHLI